MMIAVVLQVREGSLLVRDLHNRQEVVVITPDARRFRVGDRVLIRFGGTMTASIPPQITARFIRRIGRICC